MRLTILWVCLALTGGALIAAAPVELVPVQKQDLKITTTQPMSVEAFYTADMGARVSGYVAAVLVDIGSSVKAGQPLLKIDAPERVARVQVLASGRVERIAAVAAAEANLKAAASERQRVRALIESAVTFIEELYLAEIVAVDIEVLDLPHESAHWNGEGESVEFEE